MSVYRYVLLTEVLPIVAGVPFAHPVNARLLNAEVIAQNYRLDPTWLYNSFTEATGYTVFLSPQPRFHLGQGLPLKHHLFAQGLTHQCEVMLPQATYDLLCAVYAVAKG